MPPPKIWLFSVKVYVAAMLALALAFSAAVQYPYWAMMVVYILALPTTGAMRQKALHMTAGSAAGATLGVISSAVFAWSEIGQLCSMALLAATAGYFALRDRLPSFYFFLLAAITCMLVALPGLTTPDQAFTRGVERVQDVVMGVGCMLLVDLLVFPVMIAPQLLEATDAWLGAFEAWCVAVLEGSDDAPALKTFLAKAASVDPVARQMRYEGNGFAWTRSRIGLAMRAAALRLVPSVSLLQDLSARPGASSFMDLRQKLASSLGEALTAVDHARLRDAVDPFAQAEARGIRRMAATWYRLRRLRAALVSARPRWMRLPPGPHAMPTTLAHTDRRYALRTSLAVLIFFTLMCLLWTFADWPSTVAIGLLLGTVFLIISGQPDDPVPLLRHIFFVLIVAFSVDMLYLTIILPRVSSFPMLAIVLSPVLLVLGTLLIKPGGLLYAILPMAIIRLTNTGPSATADMLIAFASGLAVGLGCVIAISMAIRRLPPGEPLRRLRAASRRALLAATHASGSAPFSVPDALDRVASIQTRSSEPMRADLADMRVGKAVLELRRYPETSALLRMVRQWISARTSQNADALRQQVDIAIAASPPEATALRRALVDLSLSVSPDVPEPETAP